MLRAGRFLAVILLVASATPVARAWAPGTRVHMADDAIKLMPQSLRIALEKQRKAVLRGVLGPLTDEDGTAHRTPWSGGTLDQQIEAEARTLVAALEARTPFEELSEGFGRLGHYVMDAGFPPGVGENDVDTRYTEFAAFCESRREKFRLVFYGHADERLGQDDFRGFALSVMNRAREDDLELARAYAQAGDPPDPAAFDDRSVPFAIGALSYSRCVTNIVRAWLAAWRLAGGDVGRTPYMPQDTPSSGGR